MSVGGGNKARLCKATFGLEQSLDWKGVCSAHADNQSGPCYLFGLASHSFACVWAIEETKHLCRQWERLFSNMTEVVSRLLAGGLAEYDAKDIPDKIVTIREALKDLADAAAKSRFVCATPKVFLPAASYAGRQHIESLAADCRRCLDRFAEEYENAGQQGTPLVAAVEHLDEMGRGITDSPVEFTQIQNLQDTLTEHLMDLKKSLGDVLMRMSDDSQSPNDELRQSLLAMAQDSELWHSDFLEKCFGNDGS